MSMFSEEDIKPLLSAICAKHILYVIENQLNLLQHLPLRPEKCNAGKAKLMQESVV